VVTVNFVIFGLTRYVKMRNSERKVDKSKFLTAWFLQEQYAMAPTGL
jgi:hypothetical protein